MGAVICQVTKNNHIKQNVLNAAIHDREASLIRPLDIPTSSQVCFVLSDISQSSKSVLLMLDMLHSVYTCLMNTKMCSSS